MIAKHRESVMIKRGMVFYAFSGRYMDIGTIASIAGTGNNWQLYAAYGYSTGISGPMIL